MDVASNNGPKILIVDDSKTYLEFTASCLSRAGYRTITSDNAWISNVVSQEKPHLILMDVQLGAVSGTEAVSILKKRSFAKGISILLHSAANPDELSALAQSCGADGYLVKDGQKESLMTAVRKVLGMHELHSTAH